MSLNFYTLCVIYLVYSFLGWVGETVVATAKGRRFTNRGVACAILLPVGLEYNKTVAGERYRAVGKAMGVKGIDEMNDVEAADATIAAVKQLSADVGIPANLQGILKEEDIHFLAESAFADACCPGNPRDTSVEEIEALYKSQL